MIRMDSRLNLKNLKITSNLQEIIEVYKQFKRNIFENWCGLHYQEANNQKNQFWEQINRCTESADPYDSVRVCIGSVILAKYSQTFRDNCSSILRDIRPQRENSLSIFIAIYTAKHAKRFRTSSQFTQSYLQVIYESLKSSSTKSFDKHYINLLYYLTVYATKEIDKCTSRFYETLLVAFANPSEEIRLYTMRTLNNYFRLTRHKQFPQSLRNQAIQLITPKKSPYPKNHGGMLIIVSLMDFFPEYYLEREIPKSYISIINSMKKDSRLINVCNLIQIALAPNFPESFSTSVENFLRNNWPDDKSKLTSDYVFPIWFALRKFPRAFTCKDNNNNSLFPQLLDLIKNLISKTEDRTMTDLGSSLLMDFMKNLPNEFDNYAEKVAHVLLIHDYSENFIPTFKHIVFKNELVLKFVLRDIESLLTYLLDDNREEKFIIFARLIASLPSIPEKIVNKIKEPLLNLLNHPNINLRKLIPPALLALCKYLPSQISTQIGITLITTSVIEDSIEMRLIILNSFSEPYPTYLSYPNILEYFTILVNDESFLVRQAALKILGGVSSKNPAMIYPMFRRILLDILFLLSASKSLRMKSDAILCLPIVFSSVVPILPIYVPIFMPIAFQQLKKNLSVAANEIDNPQNFKTIPFYQHPMMSYNSISSYQKFPYDRQLSNSLDFKPPINGQISNPSLSTIKESVAQRIITEEQMSFFERMFNTKITENFISTIGCICEKNFALIRPFVKDITKILLETIGRAAYKSILLASIDTLGKIIDQLGPIESAQITDLNTTLLKLGSRIISSKLYTAIFRTLGKIGPISPQNSLNIEISEVKAPENVDLSVSRDDYFVRAVVTCLFFVLDDKSESDLHSDAHLALSRTFSTCKKSVNSQRLFKSYVARLLTTIRALAPDDRSKYFKYIATILRCPVEWLQPFSIHFFQLIEDLWDTENNVDVLDIIPKLASRLKDEFAHYLPRVVTHLLDALTSCCSISSYDMCKAQLILKTICELSKFASQFVFIIINQICVTIVELKVTDALITTALDSIRSLIQNFNCTTYSSIIMRCCFQLIRKNPSLKEKILQVIYSLAVSMGSKFTNYVDSIKDHDLMTPEMDSILNSRKKKKLSDFPFIIVDKQEPEIYEWKPNTKIDEDDLTSITLIPNTSITEEQWKSWIRTFIKAFITHSPVPAIQSCIPISEKSPLFNRKIFNPAFLSCWANMHRESRMLIQTYIMQALSIDNTTPSVVTALIGLVEFIDRAGMPMKGNYFNITKSAINAGKRTFALYCAQRDFDDTKQRSALNIEILIQIYSQLGMFDEVRGMEKIVSNLLPHNEKLEQKLTKLELTENWSSIAKNFDTFLLKPEPEKKHSNVIFAHAFYHLNDWKNFDTSIAQNQDSPNSIIMNCLRGLSLKKDISSLIEEGFVHLGKQGGPLFLHGFTAVAPYIVNAEQFVEIQEYFNNKNIDHWEKRLVPIKCTFNTIRPLLHMRMDILQNDGPLKVFPHQLSFLKLARKANEWKAFEQFYDLHFKEQSCCGSLMNRYQQLQIKYEYLHLLKKKGSISEALEYLDNCVSGQPKNNNERDIFSKFYFKKAKWIARLNNEDVIGQMSRVIDLCNMSLEMRPHHYSVKNLWSWANMHLFTHCSNENNFLFSLSSDSVDKNKENGQINTQIQAQAAIDAITGFASCLKLDFKDTFFDLLQMTSILFRSTNIPGVFDASIEAVKSVQLKRFIKVIPQLLVYQYTHSIPHQKLVADILIKLLTQYPNSVIFPLLFVNNTKRNTNIDVADMLKSFAMNHSEFYESAVNILNGLKKACITLPEYFTEALSKISNKIKKNKIESLESLIPVLIQKLKKALNEAESPYEAAFVSKYGNILKSVVATLEKYMHNRDLNEFINLTSSWADYYDNVNKDLQNELQVSLKYIAPELENFDNKMEMTQMIALMSTNSKNIKDEKKTKFLLDDENKGLLSNFHTQKVLSPSNYDSENSLMKDQYDQKKLRRQNFYKMPLKNEDKSISKKSANDNILNYKTQVVDSPVCDDSLVVENNRKKNIKNKFYGGINNNEGQDLTSIIISNDKKNKNSKFLASAKQVISPDMTDSDNSINVDNGKSSKLTVEHSGNVKTESQSSDDSFEQEKRKKEQRKNNFYGTFNDINKNDKQQNSTKFFTSAKHVPSPDMTDSENSINIGRFNLVNDKSSKLTGSMNPNKIPPRKDNIKTGLNKLIESQSSDDSFEQEKNKKEQRKNNFYGTFTDINNNDKDVPSPDMADSENSINIGRFNLDNDKSSKLTGNMNPNKSPPQQENAKIGLNKLIESQSSDDSFEQEKRKKEQRKNNFYGTFTDINKNDKQQNSTKFFTSAKHVPSPDMTDSENSINIGRFNLVNDKSSKLTGSMNPNKIPPRKDNIKTGLNKLIESQSSDDSFEQEKNKKELKRNNFYGVFTDTKEDAKSSPKSPQKSPNSSKFLTSSKQVLSPDMTDSDSVHKFSHGGEKRSENPASPSIITQGKTASKSLFSNLKTAKVESPSSSYESSDNERRRKSQQQQPSAANSAASSQKKSSSSSIPSSSSLPHVVNMSSATATATKLRSIRRTQQCQLAVFNTFDPDKPVITISKFLDDVKIKLSKHRPRKIVIAGSDGKLYKFLLKGHEDLRVDQRMMQYFELMNSIASASMPQITITGVTPLAPNVGLIQWVKQCDLMKGLIIEFRKIGPNYNTYGNSDANTNNNNNEANNNANNNNNVGGAADNGNMGLNDEKKNFVIDPVNKELSMMKFMTTCNVDKLMPIHRLECIKNIMKETSANDLRDMMWLKAQDAESWIRHTFNFSKTSAVMSIVGYIIGLGDRHPANIMIQRSTGRVIHIDFGDYFEVSKERKYLAEKIPFRLTRMMIATFGPCGIEGSFRATCEATVQTIREHREAVMSILEIFIREPCSSGDFFYNSSKIENKMEIISGSVGIIKGSTKSHDKLLKNMSTISKKIDGLDFDNEIPLSVSEQVDNLISSATDAYNLAYLYHGWNPLW